jgi:hypothetical protein
MAAAVKFDNRDLAARAARFLALGKPVVVQRTMWPQGHRLRTLPLAAPIWLATLPRTVFRCAICGIKVGSHHPRPGKRSWRFGHGEPFTCNTHGQLQDPEYDEWLAEWRRRGRPDSFNLRLNPIQ